MTAIEFENISKQYRLGLVSTGTLSHDLNRFWQTKVLRREDPYLKVGEVNDRRKILIYLTDEAKALEQDYNAVTAEIESIYYKGFSSEEIDALEGYLRRVLTNVEEAL